MFSIKLTKCYFELSNESNFPEITKLFHVNATYSSQNTWLYLWVKDIIDMQKIFHWSFEKLEWQLNEISEEKPWIVRVDFDFSGIKDWEQIHFSGIEYVVVVDDKIQHIEIRNK